MPDISTPLSPYLHARKLPRYSRKALVLSVRCTDRTSSQPIKAAYPTYAQNNAATTAARVKVPICCEPLRRHQSGTRDSHLHRMTA